VQKKYQGWVQRRSQTFESGGTKTPTPKASNTRHQRHRVDAKGVEWRDTEGIEGVGEWVSPSQPTKGSGGAS